MTAGLRTLIPAALLLAAWPLGELGGAAVGAFGLSPIAFLAVLIGLAAAIGSADGWGVRPTVAKAAAGGFPLPITANRVRLTTAIAAFGAAALAAQVLSTEARTRWNVRELKAAGVYHPPGGAPPVVSAARWKAVAPLIANVHRLDSYVRGVAHRAGLAPPGWMTLAVFRAIPLTAGLLAATTVWRLTRIEREPGAQAPAVRRSAGGADGRSLRSGLKPENASE